KVSGRELTRTVGGRAPPVPNVEKRKYWKLICFFCLVLLNNQVGYVASIRDLRDLHTAQTCIRKATVVVFAGLYAGDADFSLSNSRGSSRYHLEEGKAYTKWLSREGTSPILAGRISVYILVPCTCSLRCRLL
ncbi:unnamed protein product, partial [Ectocarpus sp. 12 AP-2014]